MERRFSNSAPAITGRTLRGYAAVYDSPTTIRMAGRSFTEVVRPGAFRSAFAGERDVVALFNHNPHYLLGRRSSGTLKLFEDSHGLGFEVELPDTATGNEVRTLIERGDLSGASFNFVVKPNGDTWVNGIRELRDVEIYDVSVVTHPAYPEAGITSLRSAAEPKLKIYRARLRLAELY